MTTSKVQKKLDQKKEVLNYFLKLLNTFPTKEDCIDTVQGMIRATDAMIVSELFREGQDRDFTEMTGGADEEFDIEDIEDIEE